MTVEEILKLLQQTALFADDAPRAASGNNSAPSDPSAE